jgi:DNA-binding transcriptional LysR family regulator
MNLARLRVFHEVARTGTFSAAAEALSYTPSAVSQQMAKLEAELGTPLVLRTPRGVALTDAGSALLERTRSILGEVRAARAELDALAGRRAGTVRLGSFPTATQTIVARALRLFARRFPDIAVTLVDDEPPANLARLCDHALDLALVYVLGTVPEGLVEFRPLFDDRFVLVVPDGHRLARATVTIADLAGETLVGRPMTPGLDQLAARCGFEPRFNGFVCADYLAVRTLVAAGEGIAVVPGLAAAKPVEGTVVRRFEDWAPRRHIMLARPADGYASPATTAMEEVIAELGAVVGGEVSPAAA